MNTIKDLCRFCTKIIEPNNNEHFLNQNIIEIITSLFNFEDKVYLYENDQLPVKMCGHCYSSLMKLYSFKIKCEDVCKYWKQFLVAQIKTEGDEQTNEEEIIESVAISTNNSSATDSRSFDEDPLKITLNDIKREEIDDSFEDNARINEETVRIEEVAAKISEENFIDCSSTPDQRNSQDFKRKRNTSYPVTELVAKKEQSAITRCPIKYSMEDVKLKTKIVKCVLLDFKNKPSDTEAPKKKPATRGKRKNQPQRKPKVFATK